MHKFYKKWFWPLIAPGLVLLFGVVILPFIIGFIYSFTGWRGTYFAGGSFTKSFVGLDNYIAIFKNPSFLHALWYTLAFTAIAVISINIVALALAVMVNKLKKQTGIFRTIFFMPNLLGGLAFGFIWQFIFQEVFSKLVFGPQALNIPFLTNMTQDPIKNLFALAIMLCWQQGGYMMIIYMNGLGSIPNDLYEAASIDGASSIQQFCKITVPMLMPTFTIVLFLTLANSFKLLDQNVALTNGSFDTSLLALQIMNTVRETQPPNYGQAQAQAVIFFIIVAIIGLFQVSITKSREVEA